MRKVLIFLLVLVVPTLAVARTVVSRAARVTNTPTSGYTYNYMYPYMNGQMRQQLNPGNANAQSTSPINAVVKTVPLPASNDESRRVIARTANAARSATPRAATNVATGGANTTVARSAVGAYVPTNTNAGRRVSPRRSVARSTRANTEIIGTVNSSTSGSVYVTASRCLADYTDCMNSYCERTDTEYNRCFCSSKLSQIESTYQPQIDSLIKQIIRAKDTTTWTDEEMTAYWNSRIGQYFGDNAWENLDDALDIDWPDASDRMQGQNAYLTGHQYCVQHLANCAYAAPNMRDVYRSEIARDCAAYEKSLDRLKTALETALETYSNN